MVSRVEPLKVQSFLKFQIDHMVPVQIVSATFDTFPKPRVDPCCMKCLIAMCCGRDVQPLVYAMPYARRERTLEEKMRYGLVFLITEDAAEVACY